MGKEKDDTSELSVWKPTSDPRIKRRGDQLYARFTKYGIRIQQRLHEKSLGPAKKSCDLIELTIAENRNLPAKEIIERVRELFGKDADRSDGVALIGKHWTQFIAFRREGSKVHKLKPWRKKTASEYDAFWTRSFEPFWANRLPTEIENEWENAIKAERERSRKGDALIFANYHKYFSGFCSYLVLKGVLLKKPRIWNPDPDKSESEEGEEEGGIVIPEDVIAAMINSSSGPFGVFIRCAALMGMRSSEITQMRKTRIDFQRNCIRLLPKDVKTGSKTGKGRLIPIHPGALKALKDQYERSGDSPYLFPNQRDDDRPMDPTGFYGQWNVLKAEVGMPAITPHDLRHSYATKIFSNPHVNPVLACKALGMTMSTAERVYIHFDETHLQAVANNFSIPEIEV